MAANSRRPVVVLTGPTAAGKSALALDLAARLGGEIVNADSMQVYRHLDIGTAKPSLSDRARVPHHLIDVVTPDARYDAARYARDARAAATAIHARGCLTVLCGGTGLYVRAFLEGLLDAGGADPSLREQLEAEARAAREAGDATLLHRRLAACDPESADRIHPHDERRLVRALEIALRTGRPASVLRREHGRVRGPFRALYLVIDPGREDLDGRIDARCTRMIEQGLLQEVRDLQQRGYGRHLRPLQAIGYRHMWPVVDGHETLANALQAMQHDTRRFARRQRTWFRAVAHAIWLHPQDRDGLAKRVDEFLAGAEPRA